MSTLEERALADSDDSDRFAGTQADTLTSFIKTSGALTAMTAERNEAQAIVGRIREVTAALDRIYVKSAEDAETGYRGAGEYADAYKYATGLLHAALEPTPKGKP